MPPADAVQEFKVQTNSYDAQYGRTAGGVVNMSLKSGTNNFHGSASEYYRRKWLDANSFLLNATNKPKTNHYLDQYGFSVDGPVKIPGLYDGKNKTFFLFTGEKYREGTPAPQLSTTPTAAMRNGDFSQYVDVLGRQIVIYDPLTTDANGNRQPFPGNIIPADRISPMAKALLAYYPLPDGSTPGVAPWQSNLRYDEHFNKDIFWNWVGKVDHNFTNKDRTFFRWGKNARHEVRNTTAIRTGPAQNGQLPLIRANRALVGDWVHVFRAGAVFNVRTGYSYYDELSRSDYALGFDSTTLGFPASLVSQLPKQNFPIITMQDYTGLSRGSSDTVSRIWSIQPNVSLNRGKHNVRSGLDLRYTHVESFNFGTTGMQIDFTRAFTQASFNTANALQGSALASMLLGAPSGGTINNNVLPGFRWTFAAPWVQDDWRLTSKLTLNLGFRWDFNGPVNRERQQAEQHLRSDHHEPGLVEDQPGRVVVRHHGEGRPDIRGSGRPVHRAVEVRQEQLPAARGGRLLIEPEDRAAGRLRPLLPESHGAGPDAGVQPGDDADRVERRQQDTPVQPGRSVPVWRAPADRQHVGTAHVPGQQPHLLQLQLHGAQRRSVLDRRAARAARQDVAGSELRGQQDAWRADQLRRDQRAVAGPAEPVRRHQGRQRRLLQRELLPNPFFGVAGFEGTTRFTNATLSRFELSRPFPEFGSINETERNDGKMWYDSAQFVANKRWAKGLTLNANYTWVPRWTEEAGFLDNATMQENVSPYFAQRKHRITASGVYQLPGRDQKGIVGRVLGGWSLAPMFVFQSGQPWDLPGNVELVGDASLKVQKTGQFIYGVKPCVGQRNATTGNYDLLAYSVAYGCTEPYFLIRENFQRRTAPFRDDRYRRPHYVDLSVNFAKTTAITEKVRMQVRLEAFNLFNSPMYDERNYNQTTTSATSDASTATQQSSRTSNGSSSWDSD